MPSVRRSWLSLFAGRRCAPNFLEALIATAVPPIVFVPHRVLLMVLLVVLLGRIKFRGGDDFGYDRTREALRFVEPPFRLFGEPPLRLIVVKDGSPILMAVVTELRFRCQ